MTIAIQSEAPTLVAYGRPTNWQTPHYERFWAFHATMTRFDVAGNVQPYMAEKVPSIEDGDWKVNPDGTMEVTWKIRPNVVWHDGTPLTAQDFVFGHEIALDPRYEVTILGDLPKVTAVRVIDPQTFVAVWREVSIAGGSNQEGIPAVPRHLVEDFYRASDAEAIDASTHWRGDFVGLGPFRLVKWELGSHIDAEAFDRFFLGRPQIDRLVIRFIPDVNVLVANLLSGALDVAPAGSMLKPEQMTEVNRQWRNENGKVFSSANAIRSLWLNQHEGGPWARDVRFRQAMLYSMDREQLAQDLQYGLTEVAHYFQFPQTTIYRMAEQRSVVKYAYDPARAQRLFAEAGWTKGTDNLLRNSQGQTVSFPCCRYPDVEANDHRESLAWNAYFQAAGIQAEHPIPAVTALGAAERRMQMNFGWGGKISPLRMAPTEHFRYLIGSEVPREQSRWTGLNGASWTNPTYDGLYEQMQRSLTASQRQEVEYQLLKIMAEELPLFTVYYNPIGVAVRKGVEGVEFAPPLSPGTTWNIYSWQMK